MIMGMFGNIGSAVTTQLAGESLEKKLERQAALLRTWTPKNYDAYQDPMFGAFTSETMHGLGLPNSMERLVDPYEEAVNKLNSRPRFGQKGGLYGYQNEAARGNTLEQNLQGLDSKKAGLAADHLGYANGIIPIGDLVPSIEKLEAEHAALNPKSKEAKMISRAIGKLNRVHKILDEQLAGIGETMVSLTERQVEWNEWYDRTSEGSEERAAEIWNSRRHAEGAAASMRDDLSSFAEGRGLTGGLNQYGNAITNRLDIAEEDALKMAAVAGINPASLLEDIQARRLEVPMTAANEGRDVLDTLLSSLVMERNAALQGGTQAIQSGFNNAQLASTQGLQALMAASGLTAQGASERAAATQSAAGTINSGIQANSMGVSDIIGMFGGGGEGGGGGGGAGAIMSIAGV